MTLTEQIRPLLIARDPRSVNGAAEIAADYLAQCRAINDRLARCGDYLRRSLRSEAVHLAECHPNVMQAAADLQPPDPRELERLCTLLGLAAPDELNFSIIEDLRIAVETELGLAPLLAQHRTLAVGQAPVRQRLAVLYALAKKDPINQTWPNEIRQLEPERLRGIEREYKTAIRESDLETLENLGLEITQTPWLKPVPREVALKIQKSAQSVSREKRISDLRELVANLLSAREDGDQIECAKLLDQWQTTTNAAQVRELDIPTEVLAEGTEFVQSTGAWLTAEKRRKFEGQRNLNRRSDAASQMQLDGGAPQSPFKRRLTALLSSLRFLVPQRFRSLPPIPNPPPGYYRGRTGMDHTV